ncbi:MAG: hypothetical protein II705_09440, partial [Clostridia bacterium]|nr:hypothetical protein [Clostridia bacterium]
HALAVGVDAGENGGYIYSFLIPSGDGGRGRVVSVSAFLYRCAKEYKADVFGFSQMIRPRFLTLDALRAYGFEDRFPRSRFNVTVSLSPDGGSE